MSSRERPRIWIAALLLPGSVPREPPAFWREGQHGVSEHTSGDGDLSRARRRPRRITPGGRRSTAGTRSLISFTGISALPAPSGPLTRSMIDGAIVGL